LKCPECGGEGVVLSHEKEGVSKVAEPCKACKGIGELSGFAKKAYSAKLTQLRAKVKSLKQSRDDLIARVTELQGKLAAMSTEVEQAVDLAEFYEQQQLESQVVATLAEQCLTKLAERGIALVNAGDLPLLVAALVDWSIGLSCKAELIEQLKERKVHLVQ